MPKTNDPYSRPINATKPEGQMLQGEFYGDKATDKALHRGTQGRPVHQLRPMVSVVPAWPDETPAEAVKPTRKRKSSSPNTDATSPSDSEIPLPAEPLAPSVTEDDLFG